MTLSGTGFGASQGSGGVYFNGAAAAPSSWSPTSITTRVPAEATDGPVVVVVDGFESNGLVFDVVPATPLTVTPTLITLAIGDSQTLSARTDTGQAASGVTWSSSNPAAVSVSSTENGKVTAQALGEATVTAISGGFAATATVRVLPSGVNFGEPIWSTQPTPGRAIGSVMAANPVTDDDPSLFTLEPAPDGLGVLVRGLREADGVNVWSTTVERVLVADKFGGILAPESGIPGGPGGFTVQALRRLGGTTVPEWSYVSEGSVVSATTTDHGIVYALEAAITTPIPNHPFGGYNSQGYVVGLHAQSGQVLFRHPLPSSTYCARWATPDSPLVTETQWTTSPTSPIVVLPNGDAVFQWNQSLNSYDADCPTGSYQHNYTLRLTRVTPTGVISTDELSTWTYAGEPSLTTALPGAVRPDGLGGVLATWATWAQVHQRFISRVMNGSVTTRTAAWNEETAEQRIMVASDGTVILPEGPNGELVARDVDTWAVTASLPVAGTPVTALDDGGIVVLANGALQTFQADGTLEFSDPTPIATALTTSDDDVVYGLDATTGALEQIMLRPKRRKIWTFLQHFSGCTPGVLFADLNPAGVQHIGLVPRLEPYVYDFKVDNPNAALNDWTADQQLGVDDAFSLWNDVAPETTTPSGLTVRFAKWTTPGAQVDIWVTKHDFVAENAASPNPRPLDEIEKVTGRFGGTPPLSNRRITGGTVRLSNSIANITNRRGFRRTTLHEVGHSLGLAHWNATWLLPAGDPYAKVNAKGTIMNSSSGTDDSVGWVADRPTRCDINAVTLALRR